MSKLDAQRAMREAKYAAERASGPTRREAAAAKSGVPAQPTAQPTARSTSTSTPKAPRKSAAKPAARTGKPAAAPVTTTTEPAAERCGHRSMNGRSCTRDAGHSETSHRYG